jgi:hypothetical protein
MIKNRDALIEVVKDIQSKLTIGQFNNEASVSQSAVLPILNALEWQIFNPQQVCPEYTLQGRRVDFALCHHAGKPDVFIEVKQVGKSEGADKQLFEYAFHVGVPLAILTTGQEWHFYLPAEQGTYQDRRVYMLDLLERDAEECAERLIRYLASDGVSKGVSLQAAREDYRGMARTREIAETIPAAWQRLVEEKDERLIERIGDKVEELCGYKPDSEMVVNFLEKLGNLSLHAQPKPVGQGVVPTITETSDSNKKRRTSNSRPIPPDGTECRFDYKSTRYTGIIKEGELLVERFGRFGTFSAASDEISKTSRNGWRDWELKLPGSQNWLPADTWRKSQN